MFTIQGPWPNLQTTVIMPSAERANSKNLASSVQTMRTMDGTLYTYIKHKRGRRVHKWDIVVHRPKLLELKQFVKRYAGSVVKVTDHNGDQFTGYVTVNPLEAGGEGGQPDGGVYRVTVQLEEKV